MKEHPILFSTEMVKQILSLLKWMTRRLRGLNKLNEWPNRYVFDKFVEDDKGNLHAHFIDTADRRNISVKFPYGKIGDVLYVRESAAVTISSFKSKRTVWYKADDPVIPDRVFFKWRPSIHMPKSIARVWLEITDVKVERVNNISQQDAKAEGAKSIQCWYTDGSGQGYTSYAEGFKQIWQSINGEQSWNDNPWVWVIGFKVLSTTGKPAALENLKQESV